MGRMNIYFDDDEDKIIEEIKDFFKIKSKEDAIKKWIKSFKKKSEILNYDLGDLI